MSSTYYGDGGRLEGTPKDILINTAYAHDCEDANVLLEGLHLADLAHATMLVEEGVIPESEGRVLLEGLLRLQSIPDGAFPVDPKHGDVYNSKDVALRDLIGAPSGWLHIGRPRREAVNVAYLIAVRKRYFQLGKKMVRFAKTLRDLAVKNKDVISPDFTYLLHAHPTRLGHYLSTFLFGVLRDFERFKCALERTNLCPAGSGSVNGSSLPLNRVRMAEFLDFDGMISHSRDGMWQVDMPMETMANLTMMMTNLNRLADELQIWNTEEFGTIELPDSLCRASVIMPQKKNPYPLAYFRGVTGWLNGQFASFAAHGKGTSGNPDSRIFIYGDLPRAMDKVGGALDLFAETLKGIEFNEEILYNRVAKSYAFATDLADHLSYVLKFDYRTAHQVSGRLVKNMIDSNAGADKLTSKMIEAAIEDVTGRKTAISNDLISLLKDPAKIVQTRLTKGGAADARLDEIFTEVDDGIAAFDDWLTGVTPDAPYETLYKAIMPKVRDTRSFIERFIEMAEDKDGKIAIIEGLDRQFSYRQLLQYGRYVSSQLGHRISERVALWFDDKPQLFASIVGTHLSQGTVVSLDVDDFASIERLIKLTEPTVLLISNEKVNLSAYSKLLKAFPDLQIIQLEDIDGYKGASTPNANETANLDMSQPAHIFFTSGTTGQRKGVVISHSAYTVPADSLNFAMQSNDSVVEFVAGNVSHAYPFGRLRAITLIGGTAVVDNGNFMAQRALGLVKNHQCNAIAVPASIGNMLMTYFKDEMIALAPQLKWFKMGTQAVSPELKTELKRSLPNTAIFQQYGTSESPRTVVNNIHKSTNPDSTGRILPFYNISIRDGDGKLVVEPGTKGRVWLKGPHIATEYWRNPEKTAIAFQGEWFVTDDIGSFDKEGQIVLHGRQDEIINFGGQKLSPTDIEASLAEYIEDKFIVFGVPDPSGILGEVPAILLEKPDQSADMAQLPEWTKLRAKISKAAGGKLKFLPKIGYGIEKIPMTQSGKPKRKLASAIASKIA